MKTTKRFSASQIVEYRKSNTTKRVDFDTLEEAVEHVKKERELHPRSKKFDPVVIDNQINPETGFKRFINVLNLL